MKLIIFDFDGVLRPISWEQLYFAYDKCIVHFGKNPDDFYSGIDGFRHWYDVDWHRNEERIFGAPYVRRPELDEVFHKHYDPTTKLFAWAPETIEKLSQNRRLAVLSSSNTSSVLGDLGNLSEKFCEVVGADKVKKLKPDPEGVLYLLHRHKIKNKDAIIVGDTPVDIRAGKAAKIKTAAVSWGLCDREKLATIKPDMIFDKPEDLLLLL